MKIKSKGILNTSDLGFCRASAVSSSCN